MMKLFSNISLRIDIKSKIVISKYLLCFSNKKKTRTKATVQQCHVVFSNNFIVFTFACSYL